MGGGAVYTHRLGSLPLKSAAFAPFQCSNTAGGQTPRWHELFTGRIFTKLRPKYLKYRSSINTLMQILWTLRLIGHLYS